MPCKTLRASLYEIKRPLEKVVKVYSLWLKKQHFKGSLF